MAGKLQSCRFVFLFLFLGFFMVFSTTQARTLNAPNYNHAMMKPMSPSQAEQGHYYKRKCSHSKQEKEILYCKRLK